MSELTAPDHRSRFRDLIHRETGIRMSESKDHLLASRLRRRLIEGRFSSLDAYLAHLFEDDGLANEWETIVDSVTTNKTDFFREPRHFDMLARLAIPEALSRTRPGATARFRLWSAASSTGAEAYSAAMVLANAARDDARLDWAILGTDISAAVLEEAERAIYPLPHLDPVPTDLKTRYVMPGKERGSPGRGRIVPELRRRTRFAVLNLITPPYEVAHDLDAIFLRNVLIYFDNDQQARVINSVASHLRPGGWLFVGHAESMLVKDRRMKQIAPAVFRRTETSQ